jgi:hypothetical protein
MHLNNKLKKQPINYIIMNNLYKITLTGLFISFLFLSCSNQEYDKAYSIGKEIAEGVSTSIMVGLSVVDPGLQYKITTSNNEFTFEDNTWPIIDVSVNVESEVLSNPKITFVLMLEIDPITKSVVGTVKNIKVDGEAEASLEIMNNTMYIETEEGTEQVQLVDGKLNSIEYNPEIETENFDEFDRVYIIGKEIAKGVSTSIMVGLSVVDPGLQYKITTSNNEFTYEDNTWPIIDVSVNVESEVLSNPKITFVLMLEIDPITESVVGTVKNIKVDGEAEPSLQIMNNTMYIETEEGTEQVELIDGKLNFIDYNSEIETENFDMNVELEIEDTKPISYIKINDPDDYTNVRAGKSTSTEIIHQIFDKNKLFEILDDSENWWKIKIDFEGDETKIGYIYYTKVLKVESYTVAVEKAYFHLQANKDYQNNAYVIKGDNLLCHSNIENSFRNCTYVNSKGDTTNGYIKANQLK